MNKTRKLLSLALCVVMLASLCACGTNDPSKALAIPTYPLTAEYMQELIDEKEDGYIVKDNSFPNTYDDMQNITLAIAPEQTPQFEQVGITSTVYKGERSLNFTFVSGSSSNFDPVYKLSDAGEMYTVETSEKVIKFATKLFGGFSDENAVYKVLKKELGKKNTTESEADDTDRSRIITWKTEIDGISCEISFYQPDVDKDEMYLRLITFMTNPGLYEQRTEQRIKDLNLITD